MFVRSAVDKYPLPAGNVPGPGGVVDPGFSRARSERDGFLRHFRFRESPFGVTPDPAFLFSSKMHCAALEAMVHSIESDLGFTVLLGAPGTGKTTLLFQLLTKYRDCARTAFVYQTQCGPHDLLRYIASELELPGRTRDEVSLHERLKGILVEEARAGRKVLIIIDEAQNLQHSSLEAIRLLSGFETASAKLMHVILAGSSRLSETLQAPGLSQLAQRVLTVCRLEPLGLDDVKRYVSFRLEAAGSRVVEGLFSPESVAEITERSGGVPRLINAICYRALMLAYRRGERHVSRTLVQQSARELDLSACARTTLTVPNQTVKQDGCGQRPNIDLSEKSAPVGYTTGTEIAREKSGSKLERQPNGPSAVVSSSGEKRVSHTNQIKPFRAQTERRTADTPGLDRTAHRVRILKPVGLRHTKLNDSYSIVVGAIILLALSLWTGWHELQVKLRPSGQYGSSIQPKAASATNTIAAASKDQNAQPSTTLPRNALIAPAKPNRRGPADYKVGSAVPAPSQSPIVDTLPDGVVPSRITKPASSSDPAVPNNVATVPRNSDLPRLPLPSVPPSVPQLDRPVPTIQTRNVAPAAFPHPTKVVQPEYPKVAKLRHVEGDVLLELQIDSNGNVRTVRTVSGNVLLRKAAEEAARQWQYPPSPEDGFSNPAVTRVRINFKLNPEDK